MEPLRTLLTGLAFGESPRWHDGRLWLCDWVAQEILAVDDGGTSEVVMRVQSSPFCIDWLPDGRLMIVWSDDRRLVRRDDDGSLVTHAELRHLCDRPWNEIVVDQRGNAYVNSIGFEMGSEEPAPGVVAVVTPDGAARVVAEDVMFPNGMAITPDGSTLILAESYGNRLTAFTIDDDGGLSSRRVWAELGDGYPDGICLDAEGAVWYADVPNQRCVRVREGGEVLQTIELDRGGFSCALGGADGRTLYIVTMRWTGPEGMVDGERTGQVVTAEVSVGKPR